MKKRLISQIQGFHEMGEEVERGDGVVKGVVPLPLRARIGDRDGQPESVTEGSQRIIVEFRPGLAGQGESVDPRAERVTGELAEKAFLGAVSVGDEDISSEERFESGPERKERGGIAEVFGSDAMDLLGRPSDGVLGMEKGDELFSMSGRSRPLG